MIYKTIDEWIKHNPNYIGAIPIEVCNQILGTKDTQMEIVEDDDIQDYKKPWVGLTDEEIQGCLEGLPTQTIDVYARRIEAKLKDKNT